MLAHLLKVRQGQGVSCFFFGLTLTSILSFGQAGRAELFGTILDPSGLAVPKAKVEGEDQATMVRYSVTSDERGHYHILGLPAGQYALTVEQPGFRTYRRSGITLRLGDRTGVDVKLDIGQPSQTIEVTEAAPLLQTASGEGTLVKRTKTTTRYLVRRCQTIRNATSESAPISKARMRPLLSRIQRAAMTLNPTGARAIAGPVAAAVSGAVVSAGCCMSAGLLTSCPR